MHVPRGFRWAGVHAGVKNDPSRRDLVVIASDSPAAAAGVFTTNRVCAAPVNVSRGKVPSSSIRAIVVNSGNANACTGEQGRRDADEMCESTAVALGCAADQVLVCSTGVIGRPMPMAVLRAGIPKAAAALGAGEDHVAAAAAGVMTTDSVPKIVDRTFELTGGQASVLGLAKGAAMIGPNMATMLAFVTTDAAVPSSHLDRLVRDAVDVSFNSISVEGHMSTNDTVLVLANGASGASAESPADLDRFAGVLTEVCTELAQKIVRDAEGASHFVSVDVEGARTLADARRIAKAVCDSPLVKTAIYGNDPNWGRICSAAGYAGVPFDECDLSLRVNGVLLYDRGAPTPFDPAVESKRLKETRDTTIELLLSLGTAGCRFWTCDLTPEYVRLNADYTT